MIYQIHNQFKDGRSKICAQRNIHSLSDMRKFVSDTTKSHPLPEGATRMVCDVNSKHFVFTNADEEDL